MRERKYCNGEIIGSLRERGKKELKTEGRQRERVRERKRERCAERGETEEEKGIKCREGRDRRRKGNKIGERGGGGVAVKRQSFF